MDHKEYSPGGSEYFPTGQEFSSPTQEFRQPPPEVTAVSESDRSGSEFHQSSGPDAASKQKRRRGLSPAMLTTAAVLTAAIIINPFSSRIPGSHNSASSCPDLELSAQSKTYLDEVWNTLPAGNAEQLLALADDPRLDAMSTEEISPYLDNLISAGLITHTLEECGWCLNGYTPLGGFHQSSVYYDGQTVTVDPAQPGSLSVSYHYYTKSDAPDSPYKNLSFEYDDRATFNHTGSYTGCYAELYRSEENGQETSHVFYRSGQFNAIHSDDFGYYTPLENGLIFQTDISRSETGDFRYHEEAAEGEFELLVTDSDVGGGSQQLTTYLKNGTITIRSHGTEYGNTPFEIRLEVIDGIIQLNDRLSVSVTSDGYYRLTASHYSEATGTQYDELLFDNFADSQEDFLRTCNPNMPGCLISYVRD